MNTATSVPVTTPPPVPVPETQPPAPDTNSAWVPGHYTYAAGQWIWISGAWATRPNAGAVWVPGSYDPATRRWTEGRWNLENTSATPTR
jgi:hypothetical protein